MAAKVTRRLEQLNAYVERILDTDEEENSTHTSLETGPEQSILREIAATAGGKLTASCHRFLKLLDDEAKTQRRIDELQRLRAMREKANSSIDEGKAVESFQRIPVTPRGPATEHASKVEESFQDIHVPPQRSAEEYASEYEEFFRDFPLLPRGPARELASKVEESFQDIHVPPQRSAEAYASEYEEFFRDFPLLPREPARELASKAEESFQDVHVPPQRSAEAYASKDDDGNTESFQGIPVPPQKPTEAYASKDEGYKPKSFQGIPAPPQRSTYADAREYYRQVAEFLEGSSLASFGVNPRKKLEPFRVLLDVSNFESGEVDVKVIGKYLVIHGKHEKVLEIHGEVSREFTRKFEIPKDVDAETFRTLFDCYGVLTVEASRKPTNCQDRMLNIHMYDKGNDGQWFLPSFEDFENEEFEDVLKFFVKDGEEMAEFSKNLEKLPSSDYIPMEKFNC